MKLFRSALAALALATALAGQPFRFVILGDRTGEAQPGVYEQVWKEIAAEKPAFVVGVGDTIEGGNDATAETEWRGVRRLLDPYAAIPLYLAPGNHDVWSGESERLFERYAGHAVHYSFDRGGAHFTILDNSRADSLSAAELTFLESDLKQHAAQPLKMVVMHRPSWLLQAAMGDTGFPLHQIAKRYGVRYIVAGHVHQMLHIESDGVTYIAAPSAGGHLRLSGAYEDGWFSGYLLAEVDGNRAGISVHEAASPHGEGRVTRLADWGMIGLVVKPARKQ